ncbi:MAG: hypothetical protein JWP20_2493 [Roseomonas sp.]|jgi:hypothetical protein|nr:hypothetical protein [Roseomonas sp.]
MDDAKKSGVAFAVLLACALIYIAATGLLSRSAGGLFPAIIGTTGAIAAVVNVVQILMGGVKAPEIRDAREARWLAALSIGAPLVYAVLLWLLGFWIASAATLLVLPWILEYRRPMLLLAIAALTMIGIRLVFVEVFDMHLPQGLLIERLLDTDQED